MYQTYNAEFQQHSGNPPHSVAENTSSLSSEIARLRTFEKWPKGSPIRPEQLASNGFVYTGVRDKVRCVFCNISVFDWKREDDVGKEHAKHNPNCPFVSGRITDNVPKDVKGSHISAQSVLNESIGNSMNNQKLTAEKLFSGMSNQTSVRLNPKHPKYMLEDDRLKTFKSWNQLLGIKPDELAKAGFYYLGSGDRVKCFNCSQNLMNWDAGDDPIMEHIKWFPNCQFVKILQEKQLASKTDHVSSDAHTKESGLSAKIVAVMNHGYSKDQIDGALRRSRKGINDFKTAGDLYSFILELDISEEPSPNGYSADFTTQLLAEQESLAAHSGHFSRNHTSLGEGSMDSTKVVQENKQLKETVTCKICMVNGASIVFLPCGHLVSCPVCAAAVKKCPICRVPIKGTVKTYLS